LPTDWIEKVNVEQYRAIGGSTAVVPGFELANRFESGLALGATERRANVR
jgi:hypothetical protein